jgi:hypothetical protein
MQNDDKLPADAKVVTLWNLVSQDLNAISSQAHCLSIHTKQLQEASNLNRLRLTNPSHRLSLIRQIPTLPNSAE